MLSGLCFGTNDLAAAAKFYDSILSTLGLVRVMQNDTEVGYGHFGEDGQFWVLKPFDKQAATSGNGTQAMFFATSTDQVDAFHDMALSLGGKDEGAPGPRNYSPGYYGAYCRDLDGNKLHVYTVQKE